MKNKRTSRLKKISSFARILSARTRSKFSRDVIFTYCFRSIRDTNCDVDTFDSSESINCQRYELCIMCRGSIDLAHNPSQIGKAGRALKVAGRNLAWFENAFDRFRLFVLILWARFYYNKRSKARQKHLLIAVNFNWFRESIIRLRLKKNCAKNTCINHCLWKSRTERPYQNDFVHW